MSDVTKTDKDMWAARMSPDRVEALSDGVFAIVITLLVLELSVPNFLGHGDTGHPTSLWDMRLELYNYTIGFLSLGIYWILHHYVFHFIKRSNGLLAWLNILYLAFVSLVPFWTRMLNENPGIYSVILYYGVFMIMTFFILFVIWIYATSGFRLVNRDIDKRSISVLKKVLLIGSFIVALGTALSYITLWAGYIFWVAGAFFVITTAYGRHRL